VQHRVRLELEPIDLVEDNRERRLVDEVVHDDVPLLVELPDLVGLQGGRRLRAIDPPEAGVPRVERDGVAHGVPLEPGESAWVRSSK
jgi:hypothetical protein